MNFLFPEMEPPLDGPLGEAIELIEKLLALCSNHGLKREAYSIAIGRELASPPKRKRGAPLVKNREYRMLLAYVLENEALGPKGRKGAKARLARALAMVEVGERSSSARRSAAWREGRRAAWREEGAERSVVEKRTLSRQNDLSRILPLEIIEAAYYVRREKVGESHEDAKARLDAVVAGDKSAEREVFDILRDLLPLNRAAEAWDIHGFVVDDDMVLARKPVKARYRDGGRKVVIEALGITLESLNSEPLTIADVLADLAGVWKDLTSSVPHDKLSEQARISKGKMMALFHEACAAA